MQTSHDMRGLDIEALDPGIRSLVVVLRNAGFMTTDSGDGMSKPADERALDVPHVFMTVDVDRLVSESHRLEELLEIYCGRVRPGVIRASYDPADRSATIGVFDVMISGFIPMPLDP